MLRPPAARPAMPDRNSARALEPAPSRLWKRVTEPGAAIEIWMLFATSAMVTHSAGSWTTLYKGVMVAGPFADRRDAMAAAEEAAA